MNHNPRPAKRPKRNIVQLVGGLSVLLLLGSIGVWYSFNLGKQSGPNTIVATAEAPTNESVGTEAEASPLEIPEEVPEEDAPSTPTPGFTDHFEAGLAPVWSVIYGHPLIRAGRLTSDIGVGIAAGDASWENYQVEFDVDTSRIDCAFVDSSNSVGVRVKDFDHAYWFVFTGCEAAWSPLAGGVKEGIPSLFPGTQVNTSIGAKHILIKVDETTMSAYENGVLSSSIMDSKLRTGGIFLQVEAQTYYDNFQVTLLP